MPDEAKSPSTAIKLRDYQEQCIEAVEKAGDGSHLVVMATGLGKTVTFANLPRHGRVLLLSHRDELVRQPEKYYGCSFGIEKATERSAGEEVVSATVQTLSSERRLHESFKPGDFDMVVTDEAHHAVAPSYKRIIDYLRPRVHLGFTATPNRADGKGLSDVFDDIVFERDLRWGIEQGYLSNIDCRRIVISWTTKGIKKQAGDFALADLSNRVNTPVNNAQVAEAYRKLAVGQTLVFATNVEHAYALSSLIPDSHVVDGETPPGERRKLIEAFTNREFPCLVNCGVFTEGTDLPLIETVLLARPTSNQSLYTQMVGRGLRLSPGKSALRLIDCVGSTKDNRLCTAPKLFGINDDELPSPSVADGLITELEDRIEEQLDTPYGWVLQERKVDLMEEDTLVAWVLQPGGKRIAEGFGYCAELVGPDLVGDYELSFKSSGTDAKEKHKTFAEADEQAYIFLDACLAANNDRSLWDRERVERWSNDPASKAQMDYLMSILSPGEASRFGGMGLTKREAMVAIDACLRKREQKNIDLYGPCPNCGHGLKLSSTKKTLQCTTNKWKKVDGEWEMVSGCGFSMQAKIGRTALSSDMLKKLVSGKTVDWTGGSKLVPTKSGDGCGIEIDTVY